MKTVMSRPDPYVSLCFASLLIEKWNYAILSAVNQVRNRQSKAILIRQILLRQCLMPKQMHQPDSANAKREQTDKE